MKQPDAGQPAGNQGRVRLTAHGQKTGFRGRFLGLAAVGALSAVAVATTFLPGPNEVPAQAAHHGPADELKIGYFANLTHAPALIAQSEGLLQDHLEEDGTSDQSQIFNAGPAAVEALNSGAIDAAYLGPNPALNSYLSSDGESLNVVSGVAYGGASLVVDKTITEPEELAGSNLASPQFGGTQDVALRSYLKGLGLKQDATVTPSSNGTVAQLFGRGEIDGAWLPEPYASLLVEKNGGHRLVNEAELWPDGKFPTTVLVVSKEFMASHPQTVQKLVDANTQAIDWLNHADEKQKLAAVQKALVEANGSSFDESVIAEALKQVHFSEDPLPETYQSLVDHALAVGVGSGGNADGLVDTRFLEQQEK